MGGVCNKRKKIFAQRFQKNLLSTDSLRDGVRRRDSKMASEDSSVSCQQRDSNQESLVTTERGEKIVLADGMERGLDGARWGKEVVSLAVVVVCGSCECESAKTTNRCCWNGHSSIGECQLMI